MTSTEEVIKAAPVKSNETSGSSALDWVKEARNWVALVAAAAGLTVGGVAGRLTASSSPNTPPSIPHERPIVTITGPVNVVTRCAPTVTGTATHLPSGAAVWLAIVSPRSVNIYLMPTTLHVNDSGDATWFRNNVTIGGSNDKNFQFTIYALVLDSITASSWANLAIAEGQGVFTRVQNRVLADTVFPLHIAETSILVTRTDTNAAPCQEG